MLLLAVYGRQVFYWGLLLADVAAIYVINGRRTRARNVAVRFYFAFVVLAALSHAGLAMGAAMVETFRGTAATFVVPFWVVIPIAVIDAILLAPAALTAICVRVRSMAERTGCTNCGYDLTGIPDAEAVRCPECGRTQRSHKHGLA